MAKISKIIEFLKDIDKDIKEEVYDRGLKCNDSDSVKDWYYNSKTLALDNLRFKISELFK